MDFPNHMGGGGAFVAPFPLGVVFKIPTPFMIHRWKGHKKITANFRYLSLCAKIDPLSRTCVPRLKADKKGRL